MGVEHEQFLVMSYSALVPTHMGKLCDSIGLGTYILQIAFLVNPESPLKNGTSKASAQQNPQTLLSAVVLSKIQLQLLQTFVFT